MSVVLRVLLVEDAEDDALLLLRELRKGGYSPDYLRVDTAEDLRTSLESRQWDVIITDHNLPGFSSEQTLELVRELELDTPVIIVSGSIGEDIAVTAMKSGANDYIMKNNLMRLIPAIERELREADNRLSNRNAQETIQRLAYHDALTGLANRYEFEARATRALKMTDGSVRHALLYLDLVQFKIINDTCGHVAGDELLRQLSVLLRTPIRDVDTLARLGGDEFGVLLEQCSIDHALEVAERILQIIGEFRFIWQDKSFSIGASIGLVMLENNNQTLMDVLRMADLSCYAAKDKGRNRIHIYRADDAELQQRHGEMQWITRLNSALEKDQFVLYRQCIKPLSGAGTLHCEFLLRMIGKDGQIILPGAFIPAAERYNLMPAIDRWVVKNAFAFLKNTQNCKITASPQIFFINLSGGTLGDEQFSQFVIDELRQSGLAPVSIGFEITETAVIANLVGALNFIKKMKHLGCHIALDDFGAGLSSFSYLRTIPADYIKIDGSFIVTMLQDSMNLAIVDSVNRIGHVAGLKTVAEFVQSEDIRQKLIQLGVDYAQGYGIHKPEPLDMSYLREIG